MSTLVQGVLVRRYKRFLADVVLDNEEEVTAHCANSGSMLGLARPGARVWVSRATNPKRKLAWTWELVEDGKAKVGINTGRANAIVEEAIRSGRIGELGGYASIRREVAYGRSSRIDLLLESDGRPPCYVEVKSVTLRREGNTAEFPDSVTMRGAKHMREMATMAEGGARAMLVYLVQRDDCDRFRVAVDIDPDYAQALAEAVANGVEVVCYDCRIETGGIDVARSLPVVI